MKQLRYLAASLVVITGFLHVITIFKGTENPNSLPMFAIGIGYLAIGVLLFLNKKIGKILGIIFTLIGLGIRFMTGFENMSARHSAMFLINVVVIISCIILLLNKDSDK